MKYGLINATTEVVIETCHDEKMRIQLRRRAEWLTVRTGNIHYVSLLCENCHVKPAQLKEFRGLREYCFCLRCDRLYLKGLIQPPFEPIIKRHSQEAFPLIKHTAFGL